MFHKAHQAVFILVKVEHSLFSEPWQTGVISVLLSLMFLYLEHVSSLAQSPYKSHSSFIGYI